jgi:DNA-binding NtrC family response regulator
LVQAMEKYLQALGYDAVSLTSSPDALYMVRENPRRFDLMITDMTMPHMTGLKLSRKILAINPEIPIVLCTGYNESITEVEAKKNGIREFVLKPITLQKMARLVRQVLDRP